MNYADIKPFITKDFGKSEFWYYLNKYHEVVVDLNSQDFLDFASAQAYLEREHGEEYTVDYGPFGQRYAVKKTNGKGNRYRLKYKGVDFWADVSTDGIVRAVYLYFNLHNDPSTSTHRLQEIGSLETVYEEALYWIKRSKRFCMNYYNKLIKNIKQEYKEELKRHNDILKGDSK